MAGSDSVRSMSIGRVADPTESEDLVGRMLRYAVRAPSLYNSQPWRFVVRGDRALVYADYGRQLPVADPTNRILTMSCGAAAMFLQVAARHVGYTGEVVTLPDSEEQDLLAVVHLGGLHAPTDDDRRLFDALPVRRTQHGGFLSRSLPSQVVERLQVAAALEGASLTPVAAGLRERVVELIADGERRRGASKEFFRELTSWTYRSDALRADGVPLRLVDGDTSRLLSLLRGRGGWARRRTQRARELSLSAPLLAVLSSDGDQPVDWLGAGMALGRLLLEAAAEGIYAGYSSQLIEEPALRAPLQRLVGGLPAPQVVLRLGYASPPPETGRRPIEEVAAIYSE